MRQIGLVVALLVVPNPLQSSDRIENRPGQHTGQQQANLIDGQIGDFCALANLGSFELLAASKHGDLPAMNGHIMSTNTRCNRASFNLAL